MKHIPNIITIGRILCVPLLVLVLLRGDFRLALYLAVFMGVSDALDGFLAKQCHWQSRLGELLDPIADKLMLVAAYLVLGIQGLLPLWLVALIVGRDALIIAGCWCYHHFNIDFDIRPSAVSKINTFCQILLVFAVIAAQLEVGLGELVQPLVIVVAITTVLSGADYARTARRLVTQYAISRAA